MQVRSVASSGKDTLLHFLSIRHPCAEHMRSIKRKFDEPSRHCWRMLIDVCSYARTGSQCQVRDLRGRLDVRCLQLGSCAIETGQLPDTPCTFTLPYGDTRQIASFENMLENFGKDAPSFSRKPDSSPQPPRETQATPAPCKTA